MIILLGDFIGKVGREDIFKPTIGNESPYAVSNDQGPGFDDLKYLKNDL
jgi:hypothetical protein